MPPVPCTRRLFHGRLLTNTMAPPSGDQAGEMFWNSSASTGCTSPPPAGTDQKPSVLA